MLPHSPAPFPPALCKGGTIGIVSPAGWPEPEWIATGQRVLEAKGYSVKIHPQNYLRCGKLAGSDKARAEALIDMFCNPEVGAIMCGRGGVGSLRLLPLLDYDLIRRNPKPFIGFSDITILLHAIFSRCGFVTWHGPLIWNLAQSHHSPQTLTDLLAAITENAAHVASRAPRCFTATGLHTGTAEGVLIGGNLSMLQYLIDTPWDWSADGAILMLEDLGDELYRLDMRLRHFALAGKFKGVRAVVIGESINISDGDPDSSKPSDCPYGQTWREVILENVPPDIPVVMDFPCGHGQYITTLPIGAQIRLAVTPTETETSWLF